MGRGNKRYVAIASAVVLLASIAVPVYAHPGRTDGDGGHYNRDTGEYHWHHGEPEHQHYDMDGDGILDCPLTFKPTEPPATVTTQPETEPVRTVVTVAPTPDFMKDEGFQRYLESKSQPATTEPIILAKPANPAKSSDEFSDFINSPIGIVICLFMFILHLVGMFSIFSKKH